MPAAVSIALSDFETIEAALDNVGALQDLLKLGAAEAIQSTVPGAVKSHRVVQTRATHSPIGYVDVSTDNCLNYPFPSGRARVVSTLPSTVLQLHYCVHLNVEDSYFGHVQSDWYSRLNTLLVNLGRLQPGWWGEDSKAPRVSACRDLERVGSYLPARTKQPEVEVDESTGSVSLIWSQQSPAASVTLVFTGDGTVIGIVAGHSFKTKWKHSVTNDSAILKALGSATAKVLLFA